jgi:hypothetical protein
MLRTLLDKDRLPDRRLPHIDVEQPHHARLEESRRWGQFVELRPHPETSAHTALRWLKNLPLLT